VKNTSNVSRLNVVSEAIRVKPTYSTGYIARPFVFYGRSRISALVSRLSEDSRHRRSNIPYSAALNQ